jgi:hypothetical protein
VASGGPSGTVWAVALAQAAAFSNAKVKMQKANNARDIDLRTPLRLCIVHFAFCIAIAVLRIARFRLLEAAAK